ncbi:actin-related protein [Hyphopichia burtonii NRRL Y-1933]|uniref:Actin-related protein n=1 Tax=Hyphopichia burtonii NRRL Y-1933 TaxID=984485 RepID=A0A1E4RE11_9ASCO|nr:actin-related protein [Hyphopichia burtonii NRRL Y-1933]ODV65481.1 actin-related protein [Hyphopichia burtonii NRRL Y-1933]
MRKLKMLKIHGQQGKKPSAEVLQRRKEGRMKAAITIAENLKKTGIGRFEDENKFNLTSVRTIPLINQKNYYTDYLKKDEQVSFVRNWRTERLLQQKIKNMKKNPTTSNQIKKDDEVKNFDDFDLNDIEIEMSKQKNSKEAEAAAAAAAAAAEEEEEEEEEEAENEEANEEKVKMGFDTIVIHPGSSNIRIGRATDSYPKTIPTVIAVPNAIGKKIDSSKVSPERYVDDEGEIQINEKFDEAKSIVTKDFKSRMRYYKRRMLPNSRETASNFNKKQEPEIIPDHNDPYKKDWIDIKSIPADKKFFVGEEALKLPICEDYQEWILRYPIKNGNFNQSSEIYKSNHEILGDLENIIIESLNDFEVKRGQLNQLKAMLVIPDLYDKKYVEKWVELLFKYVGFGRVGIIQESVAATFGAGALTACVVDVGSQTTSIACVDEGMILNNLRIKLNYGGDDITKTFIKLLLQQLFPYKEINLEKKVDDWELATNLKHNFITFQDADIAVQLYNFYKRRPFKNTEKYEFKVYDEVMLAPLGVFYPELYQIPPYFTNDKLFSESVDQYTSKSNNPYSRSQEMLGNQENYCDMLEEVLLKKLVEEKTKIKNTNPYQRPKFTKYSFGDESEEEKRFKPDEMPTLTTSLEKAIIESITNAGLANDLSKIKKLYDNILIVGGGFAKISGYDLILNDRINIWRPKFLSTSALDDIIEYVTNEQNKLDQLKKELILQEKHKKKQHLMETSSQQQNIPSNVEDIELDEDVLLQIQNQTNLDIDLDYIDSISEQGQSFSVNVLPPPREFDPEMLTWKGGSVYGRLKVVNEMWITYKDWDLLESRCLSYKSLFNY